MSTIESLPNEILSIVFSNLSWVELNDIIKALQSYPRCNRMVILLYQQFFSKMFMIITGDERKQSEMEPSIISLDEAFRCSNGSASLFQRIRPKYIQVEFNRNGEEIETFLNYLRTFRDILRLYNSESSNSFDGVSVMRFLVGDYPEYGLISCDDASIIVSDTLQELSSSKNLVSKVQKIKISGIDIGSVYKSHFLPHLSKFNSLNYLDLSHTMLQSNDLVGLDAFNQGITLPEGLMVLNLDDNNLTTITSEFLKYLPSSLEVLSLNNNRIREIGPCILVSVLPNLLTLKLNYNPLSRLFPPMFGSCRSFLSLELEMTFLSSETIDNIKNIANSRGFRVKF